MPIDNPAGVPEAPNDGSYYARRDLAWNSFVPGGGGGAFRGALIRMAADQAAVSYTAATAIPFDTEVYDTDGLFNPADPSILTMPAGITRVQFQGQVFVSGGMTANLVSNLTLFKNSSSIFDGASRANGYTGATVTPSLGLNLSSPVISIAELDVFQLFFQMFTDTTIDISAGRTWFACRIIE